MKFKDMQTFSFPGELTYMMADFDLKKKKKKGCMFKSGLVF